MFECPAINAEEFGKGIEDDHADLHLLRRPNDPNLRSSREIWGENRKIEKSRRFPENKPDETGWIMPVGNVYRA